MSQAIWTWRVSGNMSGARREPSSTAGSIFLAVAKASPFSSNQDRLPRMLLSRSTDIDCIESFMFFLKVRAQFGAPILVAV